MNIDDAIYEVAEAAMKYARRAAGTQAATYARLLQSYQEGMAKDLLHPFNLDRAAQLDMDQCFNAIWREVFYDIDDLDPDDDNTAFRLCRSAARMHAVLTRDLLRQPGHQSPLSRSTSVTSNLHDDIITHAKAKWLAQWEYDAAFNTVLAWAANADPKAP